MADLVILPKTVGLPPVPRLVWGWRHLQDPGHPVYVLDVREENIGLKNVDLRPIEMELLCQETSCEALPGPAKQ